MFIEVWNVITVQLGEKPMEPSIKYSKHHSENFNFILKLLYLARICVTVNVMSCS